MVLPLSGSLPASCLPPVATHNKYRELCDAPALSWSEDLAEGAQAWANRCAWEHAGGRVGDNLGEGGGVWQADNFENMVRLW